MYIFWWSSYWIIQKTFYPITATLLAWHGIRAWPSFSFSRSLTTMAETGNNNQNRVATEVRRTISPYDLTAADNSRAVISHPILKSNNYVEWACGFRTVLHSRKKFGFLDGTIPQPAATSPDLEDWWTINALIFSWMKMTIHPDLLTNISHRDVAIELWEHIRKRFSVSNGPRNQKMKADLATCKQSGTSVETYYGKLNKIWDNINNYRPLRTCTCGRCTCNLEEQQKKDKEDDMVHQFLYGLDDTHFHTIWSSLTSCVPLPSLEEVYNIVRQEEDVFNNRQTNQRSRRLQLRRDPVTEQRIEKDSVFADTVIMEGTRLITVLSS